MRSSESLAGLALAFLSGDRNGDEGGGPRRCRRTIPGHCSFGGWQCYDSHIALGTGRGMSAVYSGVCRTIINFAGGRVLIRPPAQPVSPMSQRSYRVNSGSCPAVQHRWISSHPVRPESPRRSKIAVCAHACKVSRTSCGSRARSQRILSVLQSLRSLGVIHASLSLPRLPAHRPG